MPPASPVKNDELVALAAQNLILERDITTLNNKYQHAVDDCEAAHNKIKYLEANIQVKKEPIENAPFIQELQEENDHLKSVIVNQKDKIEDIELFKKG